MKEAITYTDPLSKIHALGKYTSWSSKDETEYHTLHMKWGIKIHLQTLLHKNDMYTIKINDQKVLASAQSTPFLSLEDLFLDLAETISQIRDEILKDLDKKLQSYIQVGDSKNVKELLLWSQKPYNKKILFQKNPFRLDSIHYTCPQTWDLIHNNKEFRESLMSSISKNNWLSVQLYFQTKKGIDEIMFVLQNADGSAQNHRIESYFWWSVK